MDSFIVRFPDGDREFVYPTKPLKEGDVIWHDGQEWRVLAVISNDGRPQTATVELDSDDLINTLRSEKGTIELGLLHE